MRLLRVMVLISALVGVAACSGPEEQGSKSTNQDATEKTVYQDKTVVVERTVAKKVSKDSSKEKVKSDSRKLPSGDSDHPDYDKVTDDTGTVSVEVPAAWDDRLTDEVATFADAPVGPSVTVSTNLDAWHNVGGVPGVYFLASRSLAQGYTDDQLLDPPNNDFSSSCNLGERTDLEREGYSGRVQAWGDCYDDADASFYTVAAAPEGRECVAVLQIGTHGEKDREAARRILDTFEVECEKADPPAGILQPITPPEETVPETTAHTCEEIYGVGAAPCQAPCPEGQIPMGEGCGDPNPGSTTTPQVGDTCPPGTHAFGDPGTGRLNCLTQEEFDRLFPKEQTSPSPAPPETITPPPGGYNCSDFSSQAEAQSYMQPGDPDGLDADDDGQACEDSF